MHDDVTPAGIRMKARWVMDAMETRLTDLGLAWQAVSATQVYTVHDIHAVLRDEIVPRWGNGAGLTWHYCGLPIEGLEFEMDVRGVAAERVICYSCPGRPATLIGRALRCRSDTHA